MALSLVEMGVMIFGGASRHWTSVKESALGRVLPLRGKSTPPNGFCLESFSRTRKSKKDLSAEMRLALVRFETFF